MIVLYQSSSNWFIEGIMALSILAIRLRRGKTGFARSSRTLPLGWRCTEIVSSRGVTIIQACDNYHLLHQAVKTVEAVHAPRAVFEDLQKGDRFFDFRPNCRGDGRPPTIGTLPVAPPFTTFADATEKSMIGNCTRSTRGAKRTRCSRAHSWDC